MIFYCTLPGLSLFPITSIMPFGVPWGKPFEMEAFSAVLYPISIIFAIGVGLFLFWRAGRHELVDSDFLFDAVIFLSAGALLFGRIFEFVFDPARFAWSFSKLVFFNVYPGIDLYGMIFGVGVFSLIFAKSRRKNTLAVLDLSVAPFLLASLLVSLGKLSDLWPYYSLGYFVLFFIIKRLERRKRHLGFFTCFYLVSQAFLDLVLFGLRQEVVYIYGSAVAYQLLMPLVFLALGIVIWHFVAKRNFRHDLKSLGAWSLLLVFQVRRVITSANDAGRVSRVIVLAPISLIKSVTGLVKFLGREIISGTGDFLVVLGIKDDRR